MGYFVTPLGPLYASRVQSTLRNAAVPLSIYGQVSLNPVEMCEYQTILLRISTYDFC